MKSVNQFYLINLNLAALYQDEQKQVDAEEIAKHHAKIAHDIHLMSMFSTKTEGHQCSSLK